MKGDPEERAVQIGRYLVQSGATVRAAAQVFGVSKSTVWKDQCRLQHLAPGLWQEVRAVLLYNKAQRHLRGGEATAQIPARTAQPCGLGVAPQPRNGIIEAKNKGMGSMPAGRLCIQHETQGLHQLGRILYGYCYFVRHALQG